VTQGDSNMKKYLPALLILILSGAVMAADGGNIVISGKVVDYSCSIHADVAAIKSAEALAIKACPAHIKAHMALHLLSRAHLEKDELALLDGGRIEPANADPKIVFAAYL